MAIPDDEFLRNRYYDIQYKINSNCCLYEELVDKNEIKKQMIEQYM